MTTVSSVLALGMMPLLLFIYSNFFDLGELKVPYETIGKLCFLKTIQYKQTLEVILLF